MCMLKYILLVLLLSSCGMFSRTDTMEMPQSMRDNVIDLHSTQMERDIAEARK